MVYLNGMVSKIAFNAIILNVWPGFEKHMNQITQHIHIFVAFILTFIHKIRLNKHYFEKNK